jgi:hypothetical protein
MPQQIDNYSQVRPLPKRYRAATTAPLFGGGGGGSANTRFGGNDYQMKSQLQQTLSRITPASAAPSSQYNSYQRNNQQ